MKVLALFLLVSLIGVQAQTPAGSGNPNGPPRDKFFEILQCIVTKYCQADPTQCLKQMENCAQQVLGGNTPQHDEMKSTFKDCVLQNGLQWQDTQPGQQPSVDYSSADKCKIMECIMKKNNTFDPFVACINQSSAPGPVSNRKHK